jgi:hypothetical protein
MEYFIDEIFFITPARLGLRGVRTQVPAGWKEICAVAEGSLSIGIQMGLPAEYPPQLMEKKIETWLQSE